MRAAAFLIVLAAACGAPDSEPDYETFVTTSLVELDTKQAKLQAEHGLGSWKNYDLDLESCSLRFLAKDGSVALTAEITPIGTFRAADSSWRWFWADSALPDATRAAAAKLKTLRQRTGQEMFELASGAADERTAWQLAAVSVRHLDALGCFHKKNGEVDVFVAIDSLTPAPK